MGMPIAIHLLKAGHVVTVFDVAEQAMRDAVAQGARPAADPAAAAAAGDVVLVIVPSDADALSVCTGQRGVLAGARRGSAVLLCSSLRPPTCVQIAAAAPAGVGVLDAALTGGIRGVEAGAINLMVGGDQAVLDRARPALGPWCASVHMLGPLGAGQVGKTVNNLIHWAQVCAITESLRLGAAYGLDIPRLRTALQASPVDSRALREIEQMRFTWHAKDMANAEAMAADVGISLPLAAVARDLMVDTTVDGVARLLTRPASPGHGALGSGPAGLTDAGANRETKQ
jgi:3-hydroxyisobutyrate dehydrogenase-like beta-hydroxyacid dehydrogenase